MLSFPRSNALDPLKMTKLNIPEEINETKKLI